MLGVATTAVVPGLATATTATGNDGAPAATARSGSGAAIRRGYVDGPWGQIHYRQADPPASQRGRHPPLVMFHQNPRSSFEYEPLISLLCDTRTCIALDTPGYGNSDPPPEPPGIARYASALIQALDRLGLTDDRNASFDAFGFHTGTFLASEIAVQRPDKVRRLALAGVPHTIGEERKRYYDTLVVDRKKRPMSGSHLVDVWHSNVLERPERMSIERAEQMLIENLRAGDRSWWAYQGVFSYPSEVQLPKVRQPVLLMAVNDSLLANTRASKALYPNATLLEMPEQRGIYMLDGEAPAIAAAVRQFLDQA